MSLMPTYIGDSSEKSESQKRIPREYEIDFKTNKLSGKIVSGLEAIKIWVWLALKVQRYRYQIYSWDYGNEYETLIGKRYTKEYLETEIKRMTEDCLLVNENITGISDFHIETEDDRLKIGFEVHTTFGNGRINNIEVR